MESLIEFRVKILLNHVVSGNIFKVRKEPSKKYVFVLSYMNLLRKKFIRKKYITSSISNLKIVSAMFLLVCFVSLTEITCETRKNVFCFTSKITWEVNTVL